MPSGHVEEGLGQAHAELVGGRRPGPVLRLDRRPPNPIDDLSWTIRFTPRRPRSNWSLVSLRKIEELTAHRLMRPAGIAVFKARDRDREENPAAEFDAAQLARFQAEPKAWEWFSGQAPSYRKQAIHHVTEAKRPETHERRMDQLIADSLQAVRLKPFRRPGP